MGFKITDVFSGQETSTVAQGKGAREDRLYASPVGVGKKD